MCQYVNANPDINTNSNTIAIKTDMEYIIPELSFACFAMERTAPPMKTELKKKTYA
jgi:hypothetical protein